MQLANTGDRAVCGLSLVVTAGSNPPKGMDMSLVYVASFQTEVSATG